MKATRGDAQSHHVHSAIAVRGLTCPPQRPFAGSREGKGALMKASLPPRPITPLAQAFACALVVALLVPRSRATPQIIDPDQESINVTSYYANFGQIPSKMADNSGLS